MLSVRKIKSLPKLRAHAAIFQYVTGPTKSNALALPQPNTPDNVVQFRNNGRSELTRWLAGLCVILAGDRVQA